MKTYTLHMHGMHCASCVVLAESELPAAPGVTNVKAFLNDHTVRVTGEFGEKSIEDVARELSPIVEKYGYRLSPEPKAHTVNWQEFWKAIPIALAFVAAFVILQKLGIVNLVNTGTVSYTTAFVIGLIASVSTCMAVVGGLVLSMSANYAKEGDKVRPQLIFHGGRLAAFFLLGGVIGAFGSAFQLGTTGIFVLSLVVGLVMLLLGVNLLDIFPWAKRLQPTLPTVISKHIGGLKKLNHTLTPFLVGIATFFLPCGFTQSMQIYTLTTGSFFDGAMTMFIFALGTLPALALLSFASLGIHQKRTSGVFFKAAGLVVIFFAIINLLNSLVVKGIISPFINL